MGKNKSFELNAADIYPEIMNIYGDRGNILYFKYRASLYGIDVKVENISLKGNFNPDTTDIVFMGGGQDAEQVLIYADFFLNKKDNIRKALDKNRIMLAICGSYQLLCDYYRAADGKTMKGISIFKGYTQSGSPRLTGNIAARFEATGFTLVGFENHGGRTYLEKNQEPLGTVLKGYGNNGEDGTEGARTNNFFGTYLHGSFLPKNFSFCDYLLDIALINRYGVSLREISDRNGTKIDDALETGARKDIEELKGFVV